MNMASLVSLMFHLLVALACVCSRLAQGAEEQWSMKIAVNYENGVSQRFDSILDGSFSTDYDPNLNEHGANTQSEPNYNQLSYQGTRFDIQTDAPFLNMINETDGRRETRRLRAKYSPHLFGLSQDGSPVKLHVISTESGTCRSHHKLKLMRFSTSYCKLRGDTWCEYQGGPLTLTTGVPCSKKLPRMAIAPIDTDMMILLDSDPQSGFLKCIRWTDFGEQPCSLTGVTLPKNRLENHYFFNTFSQKTLVQVHLMERNIFIQYIIDRFGSIRLLYSSDNTEKNPQCPMLNPNIFNCTVGMKFWNGTKLVHLDGAIGEPQSFQKNGSGVAYVMQGGGESAVVVVHALLSEGRQVLDNSTQVCTDSTAVKSVYILGGGSVIVVAQCFPNENPVFQVYLYQTNKARYELVPTRQPLQLKSGRSGKVLNVLLIGKPFLVPTVTVPSITVLPPGGHDAVTAAPGLYSSVIIVAVTIPVCLVLLTVIVSVIVGVGIIFYCLCRKRPRKLIRRRRNSVGSKEWLLDDEECEGQPDRVDGVRGTRSSSPPGDGDGVVVVDIHGNLALYHDKNRQGSASSSDSEAHELSSLPSMSIQVTPLNGSRGDTATAITVVPEEPSPTRPEMTTPRTGLELTTPPAGLELTTPPTRPELTASPNRPEVTTPPAGPELTAPPTGHEMTTSATKPELTAPPIRPGMTTPSSRPGIITPPARPELTASPTGPEVTTPPIGPELTAPPTGHEMTTSATKPELTAPPIRPGMTTPSSRPGIITPPARPELTASPTRPSPPTGLEMTTPPTGPELTTPSTRSKLTTTLTEPELTAPPIRQGMATPSSRPGIITPPIGPETTIPPIGPEMANSSSPPGILTPPTGSELTASPTQVTTTTSPTKPELTAPSTGLEMTIPPTQPEMATSPTGLQLSAPFTGPEMPIPHTKPKLTTQPTGPELTAPPSSRSEMITPPTRPVLATSQVSEVPQPQVCVHWTVQGVIRERNEAREESVPSAEEQPPAQALLTLYSVEEVEAKQSVEETGSAVSQLAGHETKVTSAEQIAPRAGPSGE